MYYSKLFITALLFLIITSIYGQRLKDEALHIEYIDLPQEKLSDDFKTYSVRASGRSLIEAGYTMDGLAKEITMDGFKRIDNYGHLRIVLWAGYLSSGRKEAKSKTRTKKDKEGNETSTTYYWYDVTYKTNTSFSIYDPEGNRLKYQDFNKNETLKTREYKSSRDRSKGYVNDATKLKQKLGASNTRNLLRETQKFLTSTFDFARQKDKAELYVITKHNTESAYKQHYEKIKSVFSELGIDGDLDQAKNSLKDAIAFYQKQAELDPGGDKKKKRIHKAANYNLALLHFYLDDMGKAKNYANAVYKHDKKDGKTKRLLNKIESLQARMDIHNIHTIRHIRDVSNALPPSKIAELEKEKEEMEESNISSEGTLILKSGERLEGKFLYEKESEKILFGKGGNTSFVTEENGELKKYEIGTENITSFSMGNRKFSIMEYQPCARGKQDLGEHIMEILYESDHLSVYKYYPEKGALSADKEEFAYLKMDDAHPVSLLDTQFLLWNKGLAKYFSDCPDLQGMCSEGQIKMNEEDLVKAARIYSELCKG